MIGTTFLVLAFLSVIISLVIINYASNKLRIVLISSGRFTAIDGLRAYLSLFVFFHHFFIFYKWNKLGVWEKPDITFIDNLGQVSVAIFFIITGFLFIGKITSGKNFDFFSIYTSRFFRIIPLYLCVVLITLLYSFSITGFSIRIPNYELLKDILRWLLFVGDSVNGYADAKRITAGVTWTLKYEWLFYFSLPLLCVLFKNKIITLMIVVVCIFLFVNGLKIHSIIDSRYFIFFMIGGVSKYLYRFLERNIILTNVLRSKIISTFLLILLGYVFSSTNGIFSIQCVITLLLFFIAIICGNNMFGALTLKGARLLGEISYSIYLLHGCIIFSVFIMISKSSGLSFYEYSAFMPVITIIVVFVSSLTYKFIEVPFINVGKKIQSMTRYTGKKAL
ncbi:acyltransferase family protein [Klebsiella aerogenes]|uniref:acyltransferase family protein n=1 Tax=Klebsiella aerogenes TaxID=548 RepID=UPI003517413E|nr:acyltransferase [Klebsiella aerogenes]